MMMMRMMMMMMMTISSDTGPAVVAGQKISCVRSTMLDDWLSSPLIMASEIEGHSDQTVESTLLSIALLKIL